MEELKTRTDTKRNAEGQTEDEGNVYVAASTNTEKHR